MKDLMYKLDFVIGNSSAFVYILVQFGLISLLFYAGNIKDIAGFSQYDIYFVLLASELVVFVSSIIGTENYRLVRDQIHQGGLDFVLIKPANSLFLTAFQRIGIKEGLTIVVYSLILLPYVYSRMDLNLGMRDWLTVLWILINSTILMNAMYWISIFVCFFWDRFFGLWWLINCSLDINHYPRDIYPRYIQMFLLYVLPIFMIGNPVYFVIKGKFDLMMNLKMIAVVVTFVMIAMWMWKVGIKKYQSVS